MEAIKEKKESDGLAIFLVSLAHASSHFYHLVIPSLFPWLMPHFGFDYVQAGVLMTAFFVCSACGQSASGFLVDKIGAKSGMYVGLGLLASSALVLGISVNYFMLLVSAVLAGLGNSVFHPVDYSLINYNISKKNLGHAFAWHNIVGNLGWAACPLFMTNLASMFDWRVAAFCASSVAIAVMVIEFFGRKEFPYDQSTEAKKEQQTQKVSVFAFLKEKAVWFCFFFFFFTSMGFAVLQSYSPTIFGKAYGLDLTLASTALTSYLVAAGVGAYIGGYLTNQNKVSSDHVVAISLAFSAIMAVVLAGQWLSSLFVIPLMAMMGFGVGLAAPSRDLMIREATVNKLQMSALGKVYGFVYCGMDVGQSLSPLIFGPFLDAGLFTVALAGVACCQVLAVFTAIRVGSENSAPNVKAV